MKRVLIVVVSVVVILFSATAFNWEEIQVSPAEVSKKSCTGYIVIEANKGIDCNGDTIRLTKKHGFFEIAANTEN